VIRAILLSISVLSTCLATDATDCCQNSVAIIVSLSGQASIRTSAAVATPASNLAWLAAGVTVESGAKSALTIILANGRRYELGERARVTVNADALTTLSGAVRELQRLPPMPKLAGIAGDHRTLAGGIRLRGASKLHLYPAGGAAALPGAVTLSFAPIDSATSYNVTLMDQNEDVVLTRQTSAASVDVPRNVVKPGAKYTWRVRAIGSGAVLAEGEAGFEAISQENVAERKSLAAALSEMKESDRLALLAAVDLQLGLFAEAVDELSSALRERPGDPDIARVLAIAKIACAGDEK